MRSCLYDKRHRQAAYGILLVVLAGLVARNDAVELGKIFNRRGMSTRKLQPSQPAENEVEAHADEARTYHTACDQELAKSLVILGEQNQKFNSAFDLCKSTREKLLDNVEYLTKKVDIINESLEAAGERCDRRLNDSQTINDEKVNQLKRELENNRNQHTSELNKLSMTHESETEELINKHNEEITELTEAHDETIETMTKAKEDLISEHEKERAEHKKAIQELDLKWKSKVKNTEDELSRKLVLVESGLKIEVESISEKLSTCDSSLSDTSHAKDSLENKYERALQKIEVLENVTAYSLALVEAKELREIVREVAYKLLDPPYQTHLKDKVDRVTTFVEKAKRKLKPITKPLAKQYERGAEALRRLASDVGNNVLNYFVNDVCSKRAKVRDWEKEKGIDPAHISRFFAQACDEPAEFIEAVALISLILLVIALRRILFRLLFALLLLPFVIFIVPFKQLIRSSLMKKKTIPSGKAVNGEVVKNGQSCSPTGESGE